MKTQLNIDDTQELPVVTMPNEPLAHDSYLEESTAIYLSRKCYDESAITRTDLPAIPEASFYA